MTDKQPTKHPSQGHAMLALLRRQPVARTVPKPLDPEGTEPRRYAHNVLREVFLPSERYVIDFSGLLQEGWQQYDTHQDATYFGVWVNRETRETLTYCEGDWSLVTCDTPEAFTAELASMAEFYGDPPPAFVTIDQDGTVTRYVDERPQ